MGNATLAKQRAQGLIGPARVDKLYDAGLVVMFSEEYEQLKADLADCKRENKLLREMTADGADDIASKVLKEAMTR